MIAYFRYLNVSGEPTSWETAGVKLLILIGVIGLLMLLGWFIHEGSRHLPSENY